MPKSGPHVIVQGARNKLSCKVIGLREQTDRTQVEAHFNESRTKIFLTNMWHCVVGIRPWGKLQMTLISSNEQTSTYVCIIDVKSHERFGNAMLPPCISDYFLESFQRLL